MRHYTPAPWSPGSPPACEHCGTAHYACKCLQRLAAKRVVQKRKMRRALMALGFTPQQIRHLEEQR